MRKGKPLTNLAREYQLTDQEAAILNSIERDAKMQMQKFIATSILPRLKAGVDITKHTYHFRYDPRRRVLKVRRVEHHRFVDRDNIRDELGFGAQLKRRG